ncbi:MAG TPA: hypothetical protein VN577_05035 [Terriglobales bacterium]|nr:hypothetical protein [Terriglobales bacterium]
MEYFLHDFTNRSIFYLPMTKPPLPEADHLLTVERAEELLEPYLDKLNFCIQAGWDAWKAHYSHRFHVLGNRARAAIVFDEIKFAAISEFAGDPDVVFRVKKNAFLLYIGEEIILRFKKMDKQGRCSNIATKQQALFQAQAELFPSGTLVSAGYTLDDLQIDIARKMVVCQLQNRVLWTLTIGSGSEAINVVPMSAPPATTTPETSVDIRKEVAQDAYVETKAKEHGKE